jgi:hypothetical protein
MLYRLQIGDTADYKSALRLQPASRPDCSDFVIARRIAQHRAWAGDFPLVSCATM